MTLEKGGHSFRPDNQEVEVITSHLSARSIERRCRVSKSGLVASDGIEAVRRRPVGIPNRAFCLSPWIAQERMYPENEVENDWTS